MRVLGNLSSDDILQVERTPEVGDPTPINGKYVVTLPLGSQIDISATSYITPVDGGDVSSLAFAGLLAQYPMYGNIVFNPLLLAGDVADIDLTATLPTGEITRTFVGRGVGPLPTGCCPNSTILLPQNNAVAPVRPGVLITDTIDISAATGGVGAQEFMVYWKIYGFSTTQDVMSDYGATSGSNTPALRNISEIDQEPADLDVYLSIDDGITYTQMGRLEPVAFCVFGASLRLAFVNRSTTRMYLACYAVMF